MEACIGVVSACLPTLRPLLSACIPTSLADSMRSRFSNPLRPRGDSQKDLVLTPIPASDDRSKSSFGENGMNWNYYAYQTGKSIGNVRETSRLEKDIRAETSPTRGEEV